MQLHSRRDSFLPLRKTRLSCGLAHILLQLPHPIQSHRPRIFNWYGIFSLLSLSVYWFLDFYYYHSSSKIPFGPSWWPPPLQMLLCQLHLRRHRHSKFLLVSRNFRCPFSLEVPWKERLNAVDRLLSNSIRRTLHSNPIHQLITLMHSSQMRLQLEIHFQNSVMRIGICIIYIFIIIYDVFLLFTFIFHTLFSFGLWMYFIQCIAMSSMACGMVYSYGDLWYDLGCRMYCTRCEGQKQQWVCKLGIGFARGSLESSAVKLSSKFDLTSRWSTTVICIATKLVNITEYSYLYVG